MGDPFPSVFGLLLKLSVRSVASRSPRQVTNLRYSRVPLCATPVSSPPVSML